MADIKSRVPPRSRSEPLRIGGSEATQFPRCKSHPAGADRSGGNLYSSLGCFSYGPSRFFAGIGRSTLPFVMQIKSRSTGPDERHSNPARSAPAGRVAQRDGLRAQ